MEEPVHLAVECSIQAMQWLPVACFWITEPGTAETGTVPSGVGTVVTVDTVEPSPLLAGPCP